MQLFEYFVICGIGPDSLISLDGESGLGPAGTRYRASCLDKLPRYDRPQCPLPPHLPMVSCFNVLSVDSSPRTAQKRGAPEQCLITSTLVAYHLMAPRGSGRRPNSRVPINLRRILLCQIPGHVHVMWHSYTLHWRLVVPVLACRKVTLDRCGNPQFLMLSCQFTKNLRPKS